MCRLLGAPPLTSLSFPCKLKRAAPSVRAHLDARQRTCIERRRSFNVYTHPRKPVVRPRCPCPPARAAGAPLIPPLVCSRSRHPCPPACPASEPLPPPAAPSRHHHRRAQVPATDELTCPRCMSLRASMMKTPALVVCVLELSGDENVVPLGGNISRNLGAKTCVRSWHFGHRLLDDFARQKGVSFFFWC